MCGFLLGNYLFLNIRYFGSLNLRNNICEGGVRGGGARQKFQKITGRGGVISHFAP